MVLRKGGNVSLVRVTGGSIMNPRELKVGDVISYQSGAMCVIIEILPSRKSTANIFVVVRPFSNPNSEIIYNMDSDASKLKRFSDDEILLELQRTKLEGHAELFCSLFGFEVDMKTKIKERLG